MTARGGVDETACRILVTERSALQQRPPPGFRPPKARRAGICWRRASPRRRPAAALTDWATISQVATAGGTLVLAVATFASIRSANRSARVAERSMLAAQRAVLIPSRDDDPSELIRFGDGVVLSVDGHGGRLELLDDRLYMVLALRNGGAAGLAVIHGWHVQAGTASPRMDAPAEDGFRRQLRDIYIPAGMTGFWQGAIREPDDPDYASLRQAAEQRDRLMIDLLYGDHEGGQRAIARFSVYAGSPADGEERPGEGRSDVLKYWNVDGVDPR